MAASKIKIKLVYKLMASYVLIFLILVGIIFGINNVLSNKMSNYFNKRNDQTINRLAEEISEHIATNDGINGIERTLEAFGRMTHLSIKYYNNNGELIYNSKQEWKPDERIFSDIPKKFLENNYIEKDYKIIIDDIDYGHVTIGYFTKTYLNDNDIYLINEFAKTYRFAVLGIIIIGIFMSIIMTRSITKPINKVTKTANEIRKGNLCARADVRSNTLEIAELSNSINYLADTLEKEDMLRSQMTSDMAHEIRTPLTTLRNFFEAFMDGVWLPDQQNMDKCYKEIIRMSDLVDKLKDIANIEETNLKVNNEIFDLSSEIDSIIELFRPQFQKKKITISSRLEKNIMVHMDKNKISQILGNLLSNAYRYSDKKGRVTINLEQDSKYTILEIKDNGIGIPEKDMPYIFERFYRSEKSRNRETGGMGVGLTIVKKLVELYNGDIQVKSKLYEGASFRIIFENSKISI